MNKPSNQTLTLVITIGVLAVSTASIFIRYAQQDVPSLVIAAFRLTIATLVLAPIVALKHRSEFAHTSLVEFMPGILAGILLAAHFAAWISSLEHTSVASSVVLVTTTPLWVALLSPLLLKEPVGRPVIIGMVFALVGGAVVGLSEMCSWQNGLTCHSLETIWGGEKLLGNFLALIGAWAAAGYIVIGRKLRAKMTLVSYIFLVYGVAAICLVALMWLTGLSPYGYPATAYGWMILLALVPQLVGHSSFNWALKYLPASLVSVTLLGEPIGSTLLAFLFLKETPSVVELMGGVLILFGIYLASRTSGN